MDQDRIFFTHTDVDWSIRLTRSEVDFLFVIETITSSISKLPIALHSLNAQFRSLKNCSVSLASYSRQSQISPKHDDALGNRRYSIRTEHNRTPLQLWQVGMITNGYEAYEEYNEVDDNYGVEETRDSNEQGDNEDSGVSDIIVDENFGNLLRSV